MPDVISGAFLFDLKATHGLPLEFALQKCFEHGVKCVDWIGFIDRARECGWHDFQTIRELSHSLADSDVSRSAADAVVRGAKLYMLEKPQ